MKKLNNKGVSPIVATLVLIVVAIVGSIAVAGILGQLSSQTADQVSAGDTTSQSKIRLLIGGSSTVQPVSDALARAFEAANQGVRVQVQGGGSGAGMIGVGEGILDLGAVSSIKTYKDYTDPGKPYYGKDIRLHEVGGSAVVVIAKGLPNASITFDALRMIYQDTDGKFDLNPDDDGVINATEVNSTGTTYTVYQRSDTSGTEETFAAWIRLVGTDKQLNSSAVGRDGNQGVLAAVQAGNAIGFVDYGFTIGAGVTILKMHDQNSNTTVMTGFSDMTSSGLLSSIKKGLKGEINFGAGASTTEVLTRNLYYVTLGNPSAVEQAFLDFAKSPESRTAFTSVGYLSIYDYK